MGIIQRQGTKNAIVNYVGVAIAAVSTLFIYPLDKELYGFAQFLYSTAYFLVPFASLGTLALAVKFFPRFREENNRQHGFFLTLLLLSIGGFALFLLLSWIFKGPLLDGLSSLGLDSQLIRENSVVIICLTLTLIFALLFTQYVSNFRRIVVPAIIKDLGYKIFLPAIFLICYLGWISQEYFAWGLVLFFAFVASCLLIYLKKLGQLSFKTDWKFLTKSLKKEMRSFMLFGSLNSLGSNLSLRIDSIMIPIMVGLTGNGIYNILLFVANSIEIPTRAINQISGPIISSAWESGNINEIKTVYKKSSINLLIVGGFLFTFLWFSIEPLFELSPKGEEIIAAKYVFLFLGLGKIIDMASGVNTHIISFSSRYRYHLLFLLILGVTNVLLNYWLIKEHGIIGAAVATAVSLVIFNLLKFVFIWWNFGIQPFDTNVLKLIILLIFCAFILSVINFNIHPIGLIFINGLILSFLYFPIVYALKLSEDINLSLRKLLNFISDRKQ